jgi:hypothetical protein
MGLFNGWNLGSISAAADVQAARLQQALSSLGKPCFITWCKIIPTTHGFLYATSQR